MDGWTSLLVLTALRIALPLLVLLGIGTYVDRRRSRGL